MAISQLAAERGQNLFCGLNTQVRGRISPGDRPASLCAPPAGCGHTRLRHTENPHSRRRMRQAPGGELLLGDQGTIDDLRDGISHVLANTLFQRSNRDAWLFSGRFVEQTACFSQFDLTATSPSGLAPPHSRRSVPLGE